MQSYLVEYATEVVSGRIIACKKLKRQMQMLLDDMKDARYMFEPEAAQGRIAFIEKECKHSISPFAGQPFILELWQKAQIEAVYGFYMMLDGKKVRRFTFVLDIEARKNGKSTKAAALANAEFFLGNIGTNIMCASNDYTQCGIVFDEIDNMRTASNTLERVSRGNVKGIFMGNRKQRRRKGRWSIANKAKIKKLSEKTRSKEGYNVDFAIVDEIHEMKDNRLIMPILQSMSTKDESLTWMITTQGFTEDGYLDGLYIEADRVLKGELDRPRRLYWIYEQDNEAEIWQNPNSHIKSNPNIFVTKKKAYFDEIIEDAKESSQVKAFMLAKDFNLKQNSAISWLPYEFIKSSGTFGLEDFKGSFYIGGFDFAETTDLVSACLLLQKSNDNTLYFWHHYWLPIDKLEKTPDTDSGANYEQWARDGHITIVEDSSVDTGIVADYLWELLKEYDLKPYAAGYDNRYAQEFIRKYDGYFGKEHLKNVRQDFATLSNPMRSLEVDFRKSRVNYNNNPVTEWCLRNTGISLDKIGRAMPCKVKAGRRIDGTAAALCAVQQFDAHRGALKNVI